MVLKKIHVGDAVFSVDSFGVVGAAATAGHSELLSQAPKPKHRKHSAKRAELLMQRAGVSDVSRLVSSEFKAQSVSSVTSKQPLSSGSSSSPSPAAAGWTAAACGGRSSVAARVYSLVTALALCHRSRTHHLDTKPQTPKPCPSVTPSESAEGVLEYQASSPDEVALVKYAEACGVQLVTAR